LEDPDTNLSGPLRTLLAQLHDELKQLQRQIEEANAVICRVASEHEPCQRLMAIPGIGPVTATAIIAAIGNGMDFEKGRGFAAWLGLVPRQHSTGGKEKLLGISKRGNCYIRYLLVHGARSVLQVKEKQASGLKAWLIKLTSRAQHNVAVVALANKLARVAWAILAKGETYQPAFLVAPEPVAA
jgi:transposase